MLDHDAEIHTSVQSTQAAYLIRPGIILAALFCIVVSVIVYRLGNSLLRDLYFHKVESVSMEPTLEVGSYVVIDKNAYANTQPKRGDIIFHTCYKPADTLSLPYIKRVVALPGEQIKIEDDHVNIDGKTLDEPYISRNNLRVGEWTVGQDKFFVLGDNRPNASDSRSNEAVSAKCIEGKVVWNFYVFRYLREIVDIDYGQ